jgi:hypothetical protein
MSWATPLRELWTRLPPQPADLLRLDRREGAAEDREVVGEDGHTPAVDLGEAAHHPVPRVALVGHPEVGAVVGGEGADLLEGPLVEEVREPLAGGALALGLLVGHALGAAPGEGELPHLAEPGEMVGHAAIVFHEGGPDSMERGVQSPRADPGVSLRVRF